MQSCQCVAACWRGPLLIGSDDVTAVDAAAADAMTMMMMTTTAAAVNIESSGCCCVSDFVAVVALSNCLLTRMAMALGQRTNFYA